MLPAVLRSRRRCTAWHTIGLAVPLPVWFAGIWLVPGIGFVAAAWGFWKHTLWWITVALVSAIASLAPEAVAGLPLRAGPYASAAVFNVVILLVLLIPRTRQLISST